MSCSTVAHAALLDKYIHIYRHFHLMYFTTEMLSHHAKSQKKNVFCEPSFLVIVIVKNLVIVEKLTLYSLRAILPLSCLELVGVAQLTRYPACLNSTLLMI